MLSNASAFAALAAPFVDERGVDVVVVMAKATFVKRRGQLVLAEEQTPVRLTDVPTNPAAVDEGRESSIRYPSDLCGDKPGADVVVVGHAVSTRKVTSLDVAVRTPERMAALRVHGERFFYRGVLGFDLGPPAPFERSPITYERAYGGMSKDRSIVDWRNPAGRGVHRSGAELEGALAPSVEDPAQPLDGARESLPVGFGAIAAWWKPRRDFAGTMDAAWQAERMPLPPLDFDRRANHVASPALQMSRPLRAGDTIATQGMSVQGMFQITVPALAPIAHARRAKGPTVSLPLVLDTALLEPEAERVELTFRSVVPLGRGDTLLCEVRLDVDA